jgi:hypothetical protein
MQAVISVPELAGRLSEQHATEMLMRPIAGVPLLLRTVLTAPRAGADQILLICPVPLSDRILQRFTAELTLRGVEVITLCVRDFNPVSLGHPKTVFGETVRLAALELGHDQTVNHAAAPGEI